MPGLVVEISDGRATVDYFGARRRVRNDFYEISAGDYVYVQGGFVVQKISAREAEAALETWKEYFEELNRIDLRLARKSGDLRADANRIRREHTGNSACVHGIVEFSNHCRRDCLYCGLRVSNKSQRRYRMTPGEIIAAAADASLRLGFKALVLQSGEDDSYGAEDLCAVIRGIMKNSPMLLIMSVGERPYGDYEKMYSAGARGALIRFETSSEKLYGKYRPGQKLSDRLELIRRLKKDGWLIMSGFILGLPGQTLADVAADIELSVSLGAEMISFGPLIPHPSTPLAAAPAPSFDDVLDTIARARISFPNSRILVTTAAETLGGPDSARRALAAGANSVMINLTPPEYAPFYSLYPGKSQKPGSSEERVRETVEMLKSMGRAPSDLGTVL